MPVMSLKPAIFEALEGVFNLPAVSLDHEAALDGLANGDPAGDPVVLQLSSSLIRVQQDMWVPNGSGWAIQSFELRLSGAGINPVSTIDALLAAINNGLAAGTLNSLQIVTGGTTVLALTMDAAGYHLTSGAQSVTLDGTLPLSFLQFADLAGLFDQVMNIEFLTRTARAALFTDLASYGVTGLTVADASTDLMALHISATQASVMINGLTMAVTGTFPDNFGEDLALLWQASRQMMRTGVIDVTTLTGLSVTGLRFTDAAGHVLGSMADPLADTALTVKMGGRFYDDVRLGDAAGNFMTQGAQRESAVMAGLGGQDWLVGGVKADYLIGGSGNDVLDGKAGADRLDGGAGRDVLTGGAGADVFHFDLGDGTDRITSFTARTDVIEILDANRKSDLTFTVVGTDVKIDFRTIHILVEDITLAEMNQVINFAF